MKSSKLPFQLEGRFLGFVMKDGYKLKGLRLATPTGELYIKLSKESRASFKGVLKPGDWLQVTGYQKLNYEDGIVQFKAEQVLITAPGTETKPVMSAAVEPSTAEQPKGCILVCQKSDCCKKGAKALVKAIESELSDRQLTEVTVKGTGCMKQCKAGPAMVINKQRYTRVAPAEVTQLIEKHFPSKQPQPQLV